MLLSVQLHHQSRCTTATFDLPSLLSLFFQNTSALVEKTRTGEGPTRREGHQRRDGQQRLRSAINVQGITIARQAPFEYISVKFHSNASLALSLSHSLVLYTTRTSFSVISSTKPRALLPDDCNHDYGAIIKSNNSTVSMLITCQRGRAGY